MDSIQDIAFQDVGPEVDKGPLLMFLKFADSAVPLFKEDRNRNYIQYGGDNLYPEYLTMLFNKSAKHNGCINGKAKYVFGKGYSNGDMIVNRLNESLNDLSKKAVLDVEIYGGFKWEIIWNKAGKVAEIYHADFACLRKLKDGKFAYKENWKQGSREQEEIIEPFNPLKPVGSQIYEYNEYRPGGRFYPLPSYIGALNWIETDIEISKFYLSSIRNGMMPSKMIQFWDGDPGEEGKRRLENSFKKKFAGSENAGKFVLVFNKANASKSVEVTDMSDTNLDKMFIELNKSTQQEIFAGHSITSPMLFGIKTEGQLGGSTELKLSYSIFQNTYAEPKADAFDKEINWLMSYSMWPAEYELQPTDPVGVQIDVKDVVNTLPREFVLQEVGVPKDLWSAPSIAGDVSPTGQPMATAVNDNIKNLSGRQHQAVMRIVRQYESGKLKRPAAVAMLKSGYGLSDEDVIAFLGDDPAAQFSAQTPDDAIAIFDAYGDSKNDFEILKQKRAFDSDLEDDEVIFKTEAFRGYDVTATEARIIELIRKDERITPEVIATTVGETVAFVQSKIEALTKRGYLDVSTEMVGEDTITKRSVIPDITMPPSRTTVPPSQIYIKYSYEGPQDSRNRPFCAKLMELNRLYSRADIEKISQRLGYSVFDRRGGFWMHHDGTVTPYCRHKWKSNIVIKKGGENVS